MGQEKYIGMDVRQATIPSTFQCCRIHSTW